MIYNMGNRTVDQSLRERGFQNGTHGSGKGRERLNYPAIIHRPTQDCVYPGSRDTLQLQLITAREDVQEAELLYWMRGDTDPARIRRVPLRVSLRDALRDYYRTAIRTEGIAAYVRYCFRLKSGNREVWLGGNGLRETEPPMNGCFFEFPWPNPTDGFRTPLWRNRQVYYQIFPDRFRNADPTLTPLGAAAWGSQPTREGFMGGDLAGITESLDYIERLGATCLYLTPIFRAASNHRYDTVDYYSIDPSLGTEEDLRHLVAAVHARGMRVILDGVFNHCGYRWDRFQDVVRKGEVSPYCDWFFIHDYPVDMARVNYDCVGHYRWMPKLNLANPDARDYFLRVGCYWLEEFDIDGWRLDVADELPVSFLGAFAAAMRQYKTDCILLGETWGDAGRLLSGGRLDSAMNYLFRDAAVAWLARGEITVSEFDNRLNTALALYPTEIGHRMYNLLDSHDTPRFLFECGGERDRLMLAAAVQMTYPGSPAIFYGDEIGLSADTDPGCRLAMVWEEDRQDRILFRWYRQLIRLRLQSDSLTDGDFRTVFCGDGENVYAFSRSVPGEMSLIVINAGDAPWRGTFCVPAQAYQHTEWTLTCSDGGLTERHSFLPMVLTDGAGRFQAELSAKSVKIIQFINQ